MSSDFRKELGSNLLAAKKLLGIARIDISSLHFVEGRQIDQHIVDGLVTLFRKTSCRRYDPENCIPVLISSSQLRRALEASCLQQSDLCKPKRDGSLPFLKAGVDQVFSCLHGRHRVRAAQLFFPPDDRWWTVKLFLVDTTTVHQSLSARWKNDYAHQASFSDGEVFRQMRKFQSTGDKTQVNVWKARLSRCKLTGYLQLLKHYGLAKAFDKLLLFPGLWGGLELGNMQRLLALKCDEEILRYLNGIYQTWLHLTLSDPVLAEYVCLQTVEMLQLRAPASIATDKNFVIQAMQTGLIYPGVVDPTTRGQLLTALLQVKRLIPSIKSLHENLKHLEIGSKILKDVVIDRSVRYTVQSTLQTCWEERESTFIETGSGLRQLVLTMSINDCWSIVYRQLWICALRNFADLGGRAPRKEKGETLYDAKSDANTHFMFIRLAYDLGFRTEKISETLALDPRRLALRASFTQIFHVMSEEVDQVVEDLIQRFPLRDVIQGDLVIEEGIEESDREDLGRRCGVPLQRAYDMGKRDMFHQTLKQSMTVTSDELPTVSFIQNDFIHSFFGSGANFTFPSSAVPNQPEEEDEDYVSPFVNETLFIYDEMDITVEGDEMDVEGEDTTSAEEAYVQPQDNSLISAAPLAIVSSRAYIPLQVTQADLPQQEIPGDIFVPPENSQSSVQTTAQNPVVSISSVSRTFANPGDMALSRRADGMLAQREDAMPRSTPFADRGEIALYRSIDLDSLSETPRSVISSLESGGERQIERYNAQIARTLDDLTRREPQSSILQRREQITRPITRSEDSPLEEGRTLVLFDQPDQSLQGERAVTPFDNEEGRTMVPFDPRAEILRASSDESRTPPIAGSDQQAAGRFNPGRRTVSPLSRGRRSRSPPSSPQRDAAPVVQYRQRSAPRDATRLVMPPNEPETRSITSGYRRSTISSFSSSQVPPTWGRSKSVNRVNEMPLTDQRTSDFDVDPSSVSIFTVFTTTSSIPEEQPRSAVISIQSEYSLAPEAQADAVPDVTLSIQPQTFVQDTQTSVEVLTTCAQTGDFPVQQNPEPKQSEGQPDLPVDVLLQQQIPKDQADVPPQQQESDCTPQEQQSLDIQADIPSQQQGTGFSEAENPAKTQADVPPQRQVSEFLPEQQEAYLIESEQPQTDVLPQQQELDFTESETVERQAALPPQQQEFESLEVEIPPDTQAVFQPQQQEPEPMMLEDLSEYQADIRAEQEPDLIESENSLENQDFSKAQQSQSSDADRMQQSPREAKSLPQHMLHFRQYNGKTLNDRLGSCESVKTYMDRHQDWKMYEKHGSTFKNIRKDRVADYMENKPKGIYFLVADNFAKNPTWKSRLLLTLQPRGIHKIKEGSHHAIAHVPEHPTAQGIARRRSTQDEYEDPVLISPLLGPPSPTITRLEACPKDRSYLQAQEHWMTIKKAMSDKICILAVDNAEEPVFYAVNKASPDASKLFESRFKDYSCAWITKQGLMEEISFEQALELGSIYCIWVILIEKMTTFNKHLQQAHPRGIQADVVRQEPNRTTTKWLFNQPPRDSGQGNDRSFGVNVDFGSNVIFEGQASLEEAERSHPVGEDFNRRSLFKEGGKSYPGIKEGSNEQNILKRRFEVLEAEGSHPAIREEKIAHTAKRPRVGPHPTAGGRARIETRERTKVRMKEREEEEEL